MSSESPVRAQLSALVAWANKFNELSNRERALVSAGVLGITWAAWFFTVNQHVTDTRAFAERDVQMANTEIAEKQRIQSELKKLAALDPNQPVEQQIAATQTELETMQSRIRSSLSQFIPPQSMTLVLRDLMADHKNLKLTLLNRLPARELLPDEERSNLYLHPMQLELEGEYLDVLDYVSSLENGDWQFNWQSFEFKTKGYPNGVATIEIETLSKDKNWLGL